MNKKLKMCPMLTGKEERKALCIGQGDVVIPTIRECLQEHCSAYVITGYGVGHCNHYHSDVFYEED